jgi:hypothetical protein
MQYYLNIIGARKWRAFRQATPPDNTEWRHLQGTS